MFYLTKSIENRPYIIAKGPKKLCRTILSVDFNQAVGDLIDNEEIVNALFALDDEQYYSKVHEILDDDVEFDTLQGTIGPKGCGDNFYASWDSCEFGEDIEDPYVNNILLEFISPLTGQMSRFLVKANYEVRYSEAHKFASAVLKKHYDKMGVDFFTWIDEEDDETMANLNLTRVECCDYEDCGFLPDNVVRFESVCFEAYAMVELCPKT